MNTNTIKLWIDGTYHQTYEGIAEPLGYSPLSAGSKAGWVKRLKIALACGDSHFNGHHIAASAPVVQTSHLPSLAELRRSSLPKHTPGSILLKGNCTHGIGRFYG